MGCADYRIYCDGDSDSDGNDLMHGVLIKKKRLGVIPRRFGFFCMVTLYYDRLQKGAPLTPFFALTTCFILLPSHCRIHPTPSQQLDEDLA